MLAPIPMIGAVAALLLLLDLAAIQVLSSNPHPDFEFVVIEDEVHIVSDDDEYRVLSISGGGETSQVLLTDLLEEPDIFATQSEMEAFFDRQAKLYHILGARDALANTTEGVIELDRRVELLPGSLTFWLQLLVANVGVLVGVAVWTFQRSNLAARHLAVTGVGLAISAMAAAIYSTRSLALEPTVFQFLSQLNQVGTLLFCAGFLCMMWNYPRPVSRYALAPFWYFILGCLIIMDALHLVESVDVTRRLPPVATLLGAGAILIVQWRHSEGEPLIRQSLLWFVFVTLSGSTLFALMVLLPPLFDADFIVSQGMAFLAFLSIYIGLAVGVARYPLFDLRQYWIKSMIWLAGGLAVIGLNLVIASNFGLSNMTILVMLAASIAAVVIPLRALGSRYVLNQASKNFQSHLPQIVGRLSKSVESDLEKIWASELAEIFEPLEFKKEKVLVVKPVVVKRGLGLVIPGLAERASYHLAYADGGTRLFSSLDVTLIETLQGLFEMNAERGRVADDVLSEERGRIRRDLHDTLGGRLLTIMHNAPDEKTASESREAIAELRQILDAVDEGSAPLAEVLESTRVQIKGQAEAANTKLRWLIDPDLAQAGIQLPGKVRVNLNRIVRELVTNAIKDAHASEVKIELLLDESQLLVLFANDGDVGDAADWQHGNGLSNLSTRVAELGGDIQWRTSDGLANFELSLPINRLRETV